ncbi:unnamed protein product, partial [Polarella glacialis]
MESSRSSGQDRLRDPAEGFENSDDELDDGGVSSAAKGSFSTLQFPLLTGSSRGPLKFEAAINLCTNLLGVGTLALPWALAQGGLLLGTSALLGAAWASRTTVAMLVDLSAFDGAGIGVASYPDIGRRVMGPEGMVAVLAAHLLYSGGLLACYLAALADVLELLVAQHVGLSPRAPFVLAAAALAAPGV